ncbi:hypothetical protein EXS70_02260 [Candidatus Peribacteria bacterium]|nr:hypothetical protein [Candidatus Peribacteria bacterium]
MKKFASMVGIATASFLAATVVFAQTTSTTTMDTCREANASNEKVKASCTGRIESTWDRNNCPWYKCVPITNDLCKDAYANNEKVKASCPTTQIVRSMDDNKCEWWKCGEAPVTTVDDRCKESYVNNDRVKASCPATQIVRVMDDNKCEWWKCGAVQTEDKCHGSKENNAKVKSTCPVGRIVRSMDDNKCEWWKCGDLPTTDNVQCVKNGCTVKCNDGGIYNVCQQECPRPPTMSTQTKGSSSAPPTCKRTKEGNCWIVRCGSKVERICPNAQ